MTASHPFIARHARHVARRAGQARLSWLVVMLLFIVAGGAVAYLAINRLGANDEPANNPATVSQSVIDAELGALQETFQTALQDELDLSRIAGQVRVFTERYPDEPSGYVLLAQVRMSLNQWEQAYAACKRALAYDPGAFELQKMTGFSAARLGRNEQALAHYQAAVQATNDQADSQVYAALGRLHLTLGNPDAAEQMFERAADAPAPGEDANFKHEAYAGLANVAVVRGDFERAFAWVERAIKMANLDSKADLAGYRIQRARIYMDAGRDDDALAMLGLTWNKHPAALWRIESARLRATLYQRAGQTDKAADYVQSVCEWHRLSEKRDDMTLADVTALLAQWQIQAERFDAARISLHNLQTLMPRHPRIDELKASLP